MLKQLLALASLATVAGGAAMMQPQLTQAEFTTAPSAACLITNLQVTASTTAHSYQYDLVPLPGDNNFCGPYELHAAFDLTKGEASERLVAPDGSISATAVWNCPEDPWGTHAPSPCTFSAGHDSQGGTDFSLVGLRPGESGFPVSMRYIDLASKASLESALQTALAQTPPPPPAAPQPPINLSAAYQLGHGTAAVGIGSTTAGSLAPPAMVAGKQVGPNSVLLTWQNPASGVDHISITRDSYDFGAEHLPAGTTSYTNSADQFNVNPMPGGTYAYTICEVASDGSSACAAPVTVSVN